MSAYEVAMFKLTLGRCERHVVTLEAADYPAAVAKLKEQLNPEGRKVVSRVPQVPGSVKFELIKCRKLS